MIVSGWDASFGGLNENWQWFRPLKVFRLAPKKLINLLLLKYKILLTLVTIQRIIKTKPYYLMFFSLQPETIKAFDKTGLILIAIPNFFNSKSYKDGSYCSDFS